MSSKMIAIIPARGGSDSLIRKNVQLLAKKPLISYTIEESLKSKYFSSSKFLPSLIVSTEDEEIANISVVYGIEVVKRPDILAQNDFLPIDVIFHALDFFGLQEEEQNIVVLLQPTSPLRNSNDIDDAIELFLNSECDSVISVCETKINPFWAFVTEDPYLKTLQDNSYLKIRR
jgi:CMP-N,N'-diacetyllegionaminic acid synthase